VNISYNPYEAMGLAKNEKGQIVRNQQVDINKTDFFKYEDEGNPEKFTQNSRSTTAQWDSEEQEDPYS
jgi:hypothetical protein